VIAQRPNRPYFQQQQSRHTVRVRPLRRASPEGSSQESPKRRSFRLCSARMARARRRPQATTGEPSPAVFVRRRRNGEEEQERALER